jgi:hypothetical protein
MLTRQVFAATAKGRRTKAYMRSLNFEDVTIKCPFYSRQNDHLLICKDDENPKSVLSYSFLKVSDCVSHKDRFCRSETGCERCPIYKAICAICET